MPRVAVIGAGISGLILARTLEDAGVPVTVFEKSRGVGGRMSTRRTQDGLRFDHGAQYFTARDESFKQCVRSWVDHEVVQRWQAPIVVLENGIIKEEKSDTDRFVAVPGMNAICRYLARDLDIRFETQVAPLQRKSDLWHVASKEGMSLGTFDVAIVSAPAGQTAELLQASPSLAARARAVKMHECWAVMLAFQESLGREFGGAFVHGSPLSWIARNSSKPGRESEPETWVLHASSDWTRDHLEESPAVVEGRLLAAFWQVVGLPPKTEQFSATHRWRFALPPDPLAESCLFEPEMKVGACGDWCAGPRVEGAFLSGISAASRILELLKSSDLPKDLKEKLGTPFGPEQPE
ncbi:MAG: renalase [Pirellulaceae bacterium]|jgi:renalase